MAVGGLQQRRQGIKLLSFRQSQSKRMGSVTMQDTSALDRGIAAHAWWKYRLFDAIKTGKSDSTVESIRASDQCKFAKWLSSLPPADRSSEHYAKVTELHKEFHEVASEILALALSGRKKEAEDAVALGSRFMLVSSDLTLTMSAWKDAASP